jgi:DNA mismatch repair ATPase MutL
MKITDLKQLDEFNASGENSMANDAMTPAGGSNKKRPADKNTGTDTAKSNPVATPGQDGSATDLVDNVPTVKTAKRAADKSMSESVEEMFAGSDLSEDFKSKATVIFEAAVNAKLQEELAILEEEFTAKLDEQVELVVSDLTEKVDTYLDYVVEQWMEDNKIAIERGIRAEIAESFIDGLRDLFIEHNINLPEEETDVLADMAEALEETEANLNEAINESIELRQALEGLKAEKILESYSNGLTDTQAEKLRALAEGVDFADANEFGRKVEIIKEQYFGGKKVLSESTDGIDPYEAEDSTVKVDSTMSFYADAISKSLRK